MVKTSKTPAVQTFARREPGFAVPVVSRQMKLHNGESVTAIGVDLSGVEVPDRSYLAEACGVVYENETIKLLFSQLKRSGEPRSLVIVSMTPVSVLQFLQVVDQMPPPTLHDIAQQTFIHSEVLREFPTDADENAEMKANMVASAFSGRESCLDFYDASPFAVASVRTTNKLVVQGVVRINLRTALVIPLIQRLRELQTGFPEDAKQLRSLP